MKRSETSETAAMMARREAEKALASLVPVVLLENPVVPIPVPVVVAGAAEQLQVP